MLNYPVAGTFRVEKEELIEDFSAIVEAYSYCLTLLLIACMNIYSIFHDSYHPHPCVLCMQAAKACSLHCKMLARQITSLRLSTFQVWATYSSYVTQVTACNLQN